MGSTETLGISELTDHGVTSQRIVARMRDEWRPFRTAVARLGLTGLGDRTAAGWSGKAMVAHVAAWHDLAEQRLQAFRTNGAIEPPSGAAAAAVIDACGIAPEVRAQLASAWDMDVFNAAIAEAADRRSAHEAVQHLDASFRRLQSAVEALSDEQVRSHVDDGRSWVDAMVAGNAHEHYAEHRGELEAAVPRTASQLVARMEAAWRHFREAVRDRGRAGLGEATGAGWAYKDVVAHTIGWLQEAVKELRTREFTRWDGPSIDAQNARTVQARALVGPEALLDELDTSYRSFVAAVRSLSDADLADDQVFGAAAFYGHLHWEHHFSELGVQL